MAKKSYKDMNLYSCIVLNILASAMELDPQQKDLEEKLEMILLEEPEGLSKSEIMHHIRSNHNMTERVLKHLEEENYILIVKDKRSYRVLPTKQGLMHVGEFNKFYSSIYSRQIEDHYRYIGLPAWYRRYK